ncbi:MAG: Thymidine kinase [Chlamydiales bacterium]|nr:Thymidine kinase [Chlamydiales bacterium]MCH9620417.1 Thymidine kinase [Chlamydiales bacterium]MCH9622937.1 Thymidine kinase [Chlamydiales bacterium]
MAKLYFRHGTVGSAKTLNLLAVAHNYHQQKKKILLVKPALDLRYGKNQIKSRAGLEKEADILVDEKTDLLLFNYDEVSCILVDEVQFLSKEVIDQLRTITLELNIPILCYGLRTDFRTCLFEGSRRLMEIADSIEEVKSTCHFCNRKGIVNLKHINGKATLSGATIELGSEEKYYPACYKCYQSQVKEAQEELAAM